MLVKRDVLRALKSFHIQIALIITILFSSLFTFFVGNGNKIGISIFGKLTTYKDLSEVLFNGLDYTKGLGFLITFSIALFIASEYQYNTWQHYISSGKGRVAIYIEKYLFALLLSMTVFLMYTFASYVTSSIIGKTIDVNKIIFVIGRGLIVYATLTSLVVFLSMSLKNYITGILVSSIFVFFEKDIITMFTTLLHKMNMNSEWVGKFSLMKINTVAPIKNISLLSDMLVPCVLIMTATILLGSYLFSKYEL